MKSEAIFDVAIVGAGIAGSALAAYLQKSKLKILLVEKDWREQDRIVGELLQPGGVEMLKAMHLEHCLHGFDAQEVTGYAVFKNGEHFTVAYPATQNGEHFTGRGFHNGKFLQELRAAAMQNSNVTAIEGEVKFLQHQGEAVNGLSAKLKTGEEINFAAKLTVVSDGIFSCFRNEFCEVKKEVSGYFLGLVLHNCQLPFPNHGHVFAGGKTPFLAYPISSTETRMLIDFAGNEAPRKGEALTQHLLQQVLPQLPGTMHSSFKNAVAEGKFKTMPNHYLPAKPKPTKGIALLGDSLNMRHPLTGGGMTVALTDVHLLGSLLRQLENFSAESAQRAVKIFYATRSQSDGTINILANALYKVFSHETLSDACFSYLKQGGKQAAQPVELLSAVSRNRKMLLKHFFAVAAHGARKNVLQKPNVSGIKQSLTMMRDAVEIVAPLLQNEQPNQAEKIALWLGGKVFN